MKSKDIYKVPTSTTHRKQLSSRCPHGVREAVIVLKLHKGISAIVERLYLIWQKKNRFWVTQKYIVKNARCISFVIDTSYGSSAAIFTMRYRKFVTKRYAKAVSYQWYVQVSTPIASPVPQWAACRVSGSRAGLVRLAWSCRGACCYVVMISQNQTNYTPSSQSLELPL